MSIVLTTMTTKSPGPDIRINCPKCGPKVAARSHRWEERMGLFFIPLLTQGETHIECSGCGDKRLVGLSLEELPDCLPDEIDRYLYRRISLVFKVLALASMLLCWFPIMGLVLGLAGFAGSYRAGGWVRRASLIGITIGALSSAFGIVAMLSDW